MHCSPCPTVRDCLAVYPALFSLLATHTSKNPLEYKLHFQQASSVKSVKDYIIFLLIFSQYRANFGMKSRPATFSPTDAHTLLIVRCSYLENLLRHTIFPLQVSDMLTKSPLFPSNQRICLSLKFYRNIYIDATFLADNALNHEFCVFYN